MNPDNPGPVYDRDKSQPVTRPDLRELEEGGQPSVGTASGSTGGGSSFNFNPDGDKSSTGNGSTGTDTGNGDASSSSDGSAGATGTTGAASSLMSKELAASTGVAGAATTAAVGAKNFFWGSTNRKRGTIGGGIVGTFFFGAILIFTMASGPAELVHLSQLLQHNFSLSQSDSESRTTSLLRSYKAYKEDDFRYTRVGYIGNKVMARVVNQFEEAGVKFTGSDVLGRPTAIEIDRSTVEENFPDTKNMSDAEFNDFLNGKLGVNTDSGLSFTTAEAGKTYSLDIEGLKAAPISSYINNVGTKLLGNSSVVTAIKTRDLKDFFGLGSLFSPFSRAIQDKISAKAADIKKSNPDESEGVADEQAASDVMDDQYASNVETIEAPGEAAYEEAHNKANDEETDIGSKVLPAAGLLYAGGCTLSGVSDAIVVMNRSLIVLPSAVEATQLISMGSQIENGGSDITGAQVSATVKGFTDSQGQNIWSGAALRAIEDPGATSKLPRNSNGQIENNLPGEYQQAFGTDTTSDNLKAVSNIMLSWFPLHYISGVVPGGQCGIIGGATIIVAGVATQAVTAIANAEDGEAGDIALNASLDAFGQNVSQGIQGQLLGPFISNFIERIAKTTVAPKLTRASFSGVVGGNLIGYGARAASNSAAILNGGIAMGNNASTVVGSVGQEQQQQFRSESFFAKIFDINDYRSLTGRLADNTSAGVGTNLQLGINTLLNFGGSLSSVFGNFIPHTSADSTSGSWTGNYNWGFPQYAIPQNMLNDPALSDPYQNAENVGKYLSSVCSDGSGNIGPDQGACGGSKGYTARIANCFGDNLTYSEDSDVGAEVWDVAHSATAANGDVNPVSDSYLSSNCGGICPDTIADCGNSDKEQWEKTVMFVNDAFNIKALDCLGGYTNSSDQSCQDIGGGEPSDSTTADNGTNTVTGVPGNGSGSFTTDTSHPAYPGLDKMLARVKQANSDPAPFCASIGGCSGKCESAVEMAWLGHTGQYLDPYGNPNPNGPPGPDSAWAAGLASGHAHPGDRNPPVGALLIYTIPGDQYGHITIYLGNNQVFSTDFDDQGSVGIQPASHIETANWSDSYVGWMDPYFSGKVGD